MERARRWGLCGLAGALVACTDGGAASVMCPPSPWRSTPPLVIAHAGGEALGPANTVEAMDRSLAAGADILDLDVRMTADSVIVAIHDRDVAATTDGNGNVDELTWRQLQDFDGRARWTGSPIDGPVRIPSLEQVLVRYPRERFSLELKQFAPSMAGQLCAVLERTRSMDRVYLSSNDDDTLYDARDACPDVLITTTYGDLDHMRSSTEGEPRWCAASPIGQPPYRAGRFDADRVDRSHRQGSALFVWTVDDPATLRQLAAAGVDGVYTRHPDVARAVFDEFDAAGSG